MLQRAAVCQKQDNGVQNDLYIFRNGRGDCKPTLGSFNVTNP
jgi:hypothetical protein